MKTKFTVVLTLVFAALVTFAATAQQTQVTKNVDKKTDELVRKMSDLLANTKAFTFRTRGVEEKIRPAGNKVAVQVTREVAVRRPDGVWIHASAKAPDQSRELRLWYDGKTLTLQSDNEKVYARTKMPPTIDEALDYIGSTLNLPTPMGDVLYSSSYDAFITDDTEGRYVKLTKIEGAPCHELKFKNPVLDWNLWIADGNQPLLCKLEIIYKQDYKSPKFSMTFLEWNLAPQIAEDRFSHQPPSDFQKIQIIGRVPMDQQQPEGTQTQTQEN